MRTADVAIAGAGIVGVSIAFHLTSAGCRNVVLFERESHPGKGSTGKSMGGVRAQFATDVNIRMSMYSIPVFRDFEEIAGHSSGYRAQGYLFVATNASHLEYLRTNLARQAALGLAQARMMSRDDVIAMAPELRNDDVTGGSFCPTDGFVDPHSVTTGFLRKAADQGATLVRDAEVTAIRPGFEIETKQGTWSAGVVVNAAGAWARKVAAMAGVDLPVEPLRRMLVPTEPFDGIAATSPMVVDMSSGFHYRPEGRGLLLAWNDATEKPGFNTAFDAGFVEKILERAVDRVPCLADAQVNPQRGWAGLYEVSPDHHCILGEAPGCPGFYLANGFSGHGVMHSPATGRILADLILNRKTDVLDAGILGLSRFALGKQLDDTAVL